MCDVKINKKEKFSFVRKVDMQGKPKPVRAHEREVGKGDKNESNHLQGQRNKEDRERRRR